MEPTSTGASSPHDQPSHNSVPPNTAHSHGSDHRVLAAIDSLLWRLRRLNPYWVFFLVAGYFATLGAIGSRYPLSCSYAPNVLWSHEWAEQFRLGILYPRWMEHPYAGLGSPTFHFYGPFCMYATLPFSVGLGLSMSQSVLWSFWAAILVLGLGAERLTRCAYSPAPRWLSVLIGCMAMVSPYTPFDAYSRGALAETWAMALFPWMLTALLRSLDDPRLRARLSLLVATAAFALCHPPSLLMGATAIAFALLVTTRGLSGWQRLVRRVAVPVLGGLALDGLYLIPAIGDQKYVNIQFMTNGGGPHARDRFLIKDMGRLSIKFVEGYEGILVPALVFLTLSVLLVVWLARRHGDLSGSARMRRVSFLGAVALVATLMMSDLTIGIYAIIPQFDQIQFTMRWMAILTVAALPVWAYVVLLAHHTSGTSGVFARAGVWLCAIWISSIAFATVLSAVDWSQRDADRSDQLFAQMDRRKAEADASATPISPFRGLLRVNAKGELILEDVIEYQPFPKGDGQFPPRTFDYVEWQSGRGAVSNVKWQHEHRSFDVDSPTGGRILLRTSAWLGWRVTVNSDTYPGDTHGDWGRMAIWLPPGHSHVQVDYVGTPKQRLGQWVSMLTLFFVMGYVAWVYRRHKVAYAAT